MVRLDRSFLERYKNRVTISTAFTVDAAMESPNPNRLDGDLHIAGRAPEVGLRVVLELINADSAPRARAVIQRAESTHAAVPVTGVWRLWPEHSIAPDVQGGRVPELRTPNADHMFEIHPVTRVAGISQLHLFHPVDGYRPGNARRTLEIYEGADCRLEVTPTAVTFTTSNWLYNDVHFLMRPTGARHQVVADGRFVIADALDSDGTLLVRGLRMVLVKGTAPERAVRALRPGGRLHVWGLPRIDFAEISRRVSAAGHDPSVLKGRLPYEIIILGVYPSETIGP